MPRRIPATIARLCGAGLLALALLGGISGADGPFEPTDVAAADVRLDKPSVPVRIEVPALGIDLPVVSSERNVRGNPKGYPLCDVAQYWTRYDLPGAPGTAWIYAHAQPGMFLPLFTHSEATDGDGLLGMVVKVRLKDGRVLRYRIDEVKERAFNRKIAIRDRPSQHRLILQTSTGPPGTIPKLQAAARLVGAGRTDEPAPKPQPRACSQPALANGSQRPSKTPRAEATPPPEITEPEQPIDAVAMMVGSGAVLLGATLVAIYLVRR